MTIEYSTEIAYGFPIGKNVYNDQLFDKTLRSEGLHIVYGGNNWSGDLKQFIIIEKTLQINVITNGESFMINLNDIDQDSIENLLKIAKYFDVPLDQVGWWCINSVM